MSFNIRERKRTRQSKANEHKSNKTVEQIHYEKMEYFDRLSLSIPRRKTIIKTFPDKKTDRFCRQCLDYLPSNKTSCIVCGCSDIIKVKSSNILLKMLADIESQEEQNEYFLNSHSILMDYFNENNSSRVEPEIKFLNVKSNFKERQERQEHQDHQEQQEIVKNYYYANDKIYYENKKTKTIIVDCCEHCRVEIKENREKDLICPQCGLVSGKIADGISYKDYENYGSMSVSFAYKRINYFTEWLNHIQAKEHVSVDSDTLNKIKLELHKERVLDSSKITHQKIKKILKSLKEPKLYDHIPAIISQICGVNPLHMPLEVVNKLKEMFVVIQEPFEMLKGDRKNFFSYPYIIYKFCEILGLDEYLSYFQLLKSREKLIKQDVLWKKIILHLMDNEKVSGINWRFIASC